MEETNRQKTELRRRILTERNALSVLRRREWDRQILEHLIRRDQERPCAACLCYVNYKSEVSTKEFILWCLGKGRPVFVPKVFAGGAFTKPAEMAFYRVTAWEELKTGYQGILEPEALPERAFSRWLAEKEKKMEHSQKPERIHLRMLLPGAVFDRDGNRIGYGGGFYDRWLAGWERSGCDNTAVLEKIGLAYDMQIVKTIPAESFDQKADCVITEKCMML